MSWFETASHVLVKHLDAYVNKSRKDGANSPAEVERLFMQGQIQYDFWKMGNGQWWLSRNQGDSDIQIMDADYDFREFRVRGMTVFVDEQTIFGRVFYDLPFAKHANLYLTCGQFHPLHITKLYLADQDNTVNRISVIG